jgi:hypothetical protein
MVWIHRSQRNHSQVSTFSRLAILGTNATEVQIDTDCADLFLCSVRCALRSLLRRANVTSSATSLNLGAPFVVTYVNRGEVSGDEYMIVITTGCTGLQQKPGKKSAHVTTSYKLQDNVHQSSAKLYNNAEVKPIIRVQIGSP